MGAKSDDVHAHSRVYLCFHVVKTFIIYSGTIRPTQLRQQIWFGDGLAMVVHWFFDGFAMVVPCPSLTMAMDSVVSCHVEDENC